MGLLIGFNPFCSVRAVSTGIVPAAGVHRGKLRQLPATDQFEVFPNGSFHRSIRPDPGGIEPAQGAAADSTDHDGIQGNVAQRFQWLALAVGVPQVLILKGFETVLFAIDDNKTLGGSKMAVNRTVHPLVVLSGKSDFHLFHLL
jgi:hypothetical protein